MTNKIAFILFFALLAVVTSGPGCGSQSSTTEIPPPTVVTTRNPMMPPTPQELEKRHFAYPDFPRITAERLFQMVQDAEASGTLNTTSAGIAHDGFTLIDVSLPGDYKKPGHIDGAINMPFGYWWVLDPEESPKSEDVAGYQAELASLEMNLATLPKEQLLIFYDQTSNDEAACMAAQMLLDMKLGYDPEKVVVLHGGYYHYALDLAHAWVS